MGPFPYIVASVMIVVVCDGRVSWETLVAPAAWGPIPTASTQLIHGCHNYATVGMVASIATDVP